MKRRNTLRSEYVTTASLCFDNANACRKINNWENELKLMQDDIIKYITNPLNAFTMIKRMSSDIDLIEKRVEGNFTEFRESIARFLPGESDLVGAIDGLKRLQIIYKLQSSDFAKGVIGGKKTRADLTAHDLFLIGVESYKEKDDDYFTQEYLELARKRVVYGRDLDKEVDFKSLATHLAKSYNRTGMFAEAITTLNSGLEHFPDDEDLSELKRTITELEETYGDSRKYLEDPFSEYFEKTGRFSWEKEEIMYGQACRGELQQTEAERKNLRCRYRSTNHFTKISPFKIEEVNLNPYMVLILDVISDYEIDILKDLTKPKISRASTASATVSKIRIAQLGWHWDPDHEIIPIINQRIEDMTNLRITPDTSEALQVQNYGIGGHYGPHWDMDLPAESSINRGQRIATVMFYVCTQSFPQQAFNISILVH